MNYAFFSVAATSDRLCHGQTGRAQLKFLSGYFATTLLYPLPTQPPSKYPFAKSFASFGIGAGKVLLDILSS